MKKPVLLLAFLLSGCSIYAQWEEIGSSTGITGLASFQTPLKYMIVNTSSIGIGRSLDNGASFQSTAFSVYSNAMLDQNDTLYIAGYYSKVERSTDKGKTVSPIDGGSIQNKGVTDMVPYKADKLLVASRTDGVHLYNKTTQTWTRIGYAGKEISCVLAMGDTIYAGVQYDGLYYSVNEGVSWALAYKTYSNGPQDLIVYNGKILLGTYGTGIKISSDNGKSWQNFNTGLSNTFVGSRFCRSKDNHLFVCGYGNGVFHYDEALKSWVAVTANLPATTTEQMAISDTFLFVTVGVNSKQLFRRPITSAIVDAPVLPIQSLSVHLSPNPCTDRLQLVFDKADAANETPVRISVSDMSGQLHYDQIHANRSNISIEVKDWPSGVYVLSVETRNGKVASTQVVKQ